MDAPFPPGSVVVVTLRDPRERIWGLLMDLDARGVCLRGLDLGSFDDWLKERAAGGEPSIRASLTFYPMARIERIVMDEPGAGAPSLQSRCAARTGRSLRSELEGDREALAGPGGSS